MGAAYIEAPDGYSGHQIVVEAVLQLPARDAQLGALDPASTVGKRRATAVNE